MIKVSLKFDMCTGTRVAAPAGGDQAGKSAHQISGDAHDGGYIADGGDSSEDPESSEDEVEDIPGIIILSSFFNSEPMVIILL